MIKVDHRLTMVSSIFHLSFISWFTMDASHQDRIGEHKGRIEGMATDSLAFPATKHILTMSLAQICLLQWILGKCYPRMRKHSSTVQNYDIDGIPIHQKSNRPRYFVWDWWLYDWYNYSSTEVLAYFSWNTLHFTSKIEYIIDNGCGQDDNVVSRVSLNSVLCDLPGVFY